MCLCDFNACLHLCLLPRTLKEIFSFHAFSRKLNEEYKSLNKALEMSIATAVKKAFTFLNGKAEPLRNVSDRDMSPVVY